MDAETLIRDGATKVEGILREAAPRVAEAAEYVVRYNWADAVTGVAIGGLMVALSLLGAYTFVRFYRTPVELEHDGRENGLGISAFITSILLVTGTGIVAEWLPVLIEPTGYTIRQMLGGK